MDVCRTAVRLGCGLPEASKRYTAEAKRKAIGPCAAKREIEILMDKLNK